MENLTGILYPAEQEAFGVEIDNLIDFNKFKGDNRWVNLLLSIVEKKDDDIFSALIMFIDDKYANKIPATLKPTARALALAVVEKDAEAFSLTSAELLNSLADIPGLSEETEGIIAKAVIVGILEAFGTKF